MSGYFYYIVFLYCFYFIIILNSGILSHCLVALPSIQSPVIVTRIRSRICPTSFCKSTYNNTDMLVKLNVRSILRREKQGRFPGHLLVGGGGGAWEIRYRRPVSAVTINSLKCGEGGKLYSEIWEGIGGRGQLKLYLFIDIKYVPSEYTIGCLYCVYIIIPVFFQYIQFSINTINYTKNTFSINTSWYFSDGQKYGTCGGATAVQWN